MHMQSLMEEIDMNALNRFEPFAQPRAGVQVGRIFNEF